MAARRLSAQRRARRSQAIASASSSSRRIGGSAAQQAPAVAHRRQPRVADHQQAAVGLAADQAAGALLQRHRRLGDEVVVEGVAALRLERAATRASTSGSFGGGNGSLSITHALQRVAGHVDAFPEALRADQHAAAPGRASRKRCISARLGSCALHQHLERAAVALELRRAAPRRSARSARSVVVSTKVRPPQARRRSARRARATAAAVRRVVGLGKRARHVQRARALA